MPFASVTRKCLIPDKAAVEPCRLGEHIRKRRLELGLTLTAAAARLGVTQHTVINWESGERNPRIKQWPAVLAFLGYDPLPPAESIGEHLQQKRRHFGWTRRELADHLDIDECAVANWERGGTIMAKAHRRLVARFVGLPEAELDAAMGKRWNESNRRPAAERLFTQSQQTNA